MNDNSKQDHPGKNKFGCTFFSQNYTAGYAGTTTDLQIVMNTQKNPYLNKATQKILAKFSYPKKSRNRKFQPKKILRSSPSLEIQSTPPPWDFDVFVPFQNSAN